MHIPTSRHVQRTLEPHTQNQVGSRPRRPFQHSSAPDCLQEDRVVKISVPFPDLHIFDNPCITQLLMHWLGLSVINTFTITITYSG